MIDPTVEASWRDGLRLECTPETSSVLTLGLCQNISNILDILRPYQSLWLFIIFPIFSRNQFLQTNHVDPFCFSDRNEVQKLWWSMNWKPWNRLVSLVAVASELWRFSGLFLSCLSLSTLWAVGWEKSCDSTEVQHYRKYLRLKDPVERPMWWHNDDAMPQNPQNDKSGHRMLCSEREGIISSAKIAITTGKSSFHTNHQPTHRFTFGKLQPGYIVQRQYDPKTQPRQPRAPAAIRATAFSYPGRNWVSWMKRMCSGWPRALSSFGWLQPSTVSLACLAFDIIWPTDRILMNLGCPKIPDTPAIFGNSLHKASALLSQSHSESLKLSSSNQCRRDGKTADHSWILC